MAAKAQARRERRVRGVRAASSTDERSRLTLEHSGDKLLASGSQTRMRRLRRQNTTGSTTPHATEARDAEVRRHLGLRATVSGPTRDLRTTPALLGLFSLIVLWAHDLYGRTTPPPRTASWYPKPLPTFSDALALVRRELWANHDFRTHAIMSETVQMPPPTINALISATCYAA